MGNIMSDLILPVVIFAGIMFVLIFAGMVLVKREAITKETMVRAIISIVVFAVIYWGSGFVIGWREFWGSGFVIGWREFDVYVQAIEFLAAVIGAGCYWIGSNKR